MNAFYYLIINIGVLCSQIIIIYYTCPDLLRIIGIIDTQDKVYEGYESYLDSILGSVTQFTKVIVSYIPIVSHGVELIYAILNITISLIGLYILYRVFSLTFLHTFNNILFHFQTLVIGNDEDYAILRKCERYAFRMSLLYNSLMIETKFQNKTASLKEHEAIVLNRLFNSDKMTTNQLKLTDELEDISDNIVKHSMQNKFMLKDQKFVENQLEIQTCIETLFNETKKLKL